MTLTRTSGCSIFASSETAASTEPPTSPLRIRLRSRTAPACRSSNSVSSDGRGASAARAARGAGAPRAGSRGARACALVLDHAGELAGGRRLVEAEDLDRIARPRLLQLLAAVVVERAHLAPGVAGDDRVADAQRAAVDEHRRDRAAADVEARLDDRPRGLGVRVRLQLELGVGDEQDPLEQVVEVLVLLRGDVRELRVAAPLLGLQALGGEVGLHAVGVRVRQVDLVHRHDDRHLGRARVRDRLARLRHHAVVGRHDEHGDVRDLRAAGAHGRERLVARRVEEGDLAAVVVDLVGADVLRDAAGLGLDDRGLADRVEQRRLAVVDVAHDRDDRRPRRRSSSLSSKTSGSSSSSPTCLIVTSRLDLGGDQLDRLVGERLRDRAHLAQAHHDLDDLRGTGCRAPARGPGR